MSKGEPLNYSEFDKKEGSAMKKLWKMLDEYYQTFAR